MEVLGTCHSWLSEMLERFIPTSFTVVCHTSTIESAEHEETVVNDSWPTTVFTLSSLANVVFIRLFRSCCLQHTLSARFPNVFFSLLFLVCLHIHANID